MRTHSLTSDTTVVIFTDSAAESLLDDLSHKPNYQRQFLSRLHDALTSSTPQAYVEKPFTGCENLKQFRAGDVMRGYCVYSSEPPSYNVFYMFQITEHEYDREPVRKYDHEAGDVLDELGSLSDETAVERYLEANNAHDSESVETLLDAV